ncbi:MAG: hypothetical protein KDB14_24870 [Planctomycetales bacterium]|nr:hypothetical protein [Planctomycetales bacterium]
MKFIQTDDIQRWFTEAGELSELSRSIGMKQPDPRYLEQQLGVPLHLRHLVQRLSEKHGPLPSDALNSIPFYSLCRGLFIPLSFMEPAKAAQVFGLKVAPPPNAAEREQLLINFVQKDVGLTLEEKLGCVLGDPFLGRRSTFRRDSLLRLLMSMGLLSRKDLLDRLTHVGDVAVLFAENRDELRGDPPLTAAEVMRLLYLIPDEPRKLKFDLLRSLLERCGKVEAFFIAKLMLRKAGFGFDYQGPLIARVIARMYGAPEEQVAHAMALTDAFHVARVLESDGVEGLRAIRLQPLVPVRPALAGGAVEDIEKYPVWVERKYDGIRFMLHKSTGSNGAMLCGAYTRTRGDWLEQVPGLDGSIKMIPARDVIVDGELYGTVLDLEGVRPASVYEVYGSLQGEASRPVTLKFAAFDLLYLNGQDLTQQPLDRRRSMLNSLLAPLSNMQLPIPMTLCEGQMAANKDDVNRLYHHFRSQGYEGVITKQPHDPYQLSARDPGWAKRKPEITLDLVLLGATYAVTTKQNAGLFGSYVIGAKSPQGGFEDVGDVAGVDKIRDAQIQQEVMREGLMTGRRIERPSSSGTRPGVELRPSIVVTVKFEGIVRDQVTGALSLRDPKLAVIRSDKSADEADSVNMLQELYLKQRVG